MATSNYTGRTARSSPEVPETLCELGGAFRCGLIVFLVSLALLNAQVTVTRLLAYRFFYHFVFFVISLAQLGSAGAGAWVYAARRTRWRRRDVLFWLIGLGVLPLVVLACYGWLSPEPNLSFAKVTGTQAYLYLAAIAVLLVALNFCGGMVLTQLFTTFRERIGRLYAADLAGASLGCLASVVAMMMVGPIRAFLLSGIAAICAALLLFWGSRGHRGLLATSTVVLVLLVGASLRPQTFDPDLFHADQRGRIHRTEWNHIARTDAGRPGRYIIDGDAETDVVFFQASLRSPEYLLSRPAPAVAIIGVGAGPQLIVALLQKASSVLAIDINPTILRWSTEEDRDVNRGAFLEPQVKVVLGEGRHALRSADRDFDVIVMHAIDTWTASAQGSYSLTENFLYTSEAMQDMLAKLRPGGIVSISRWLFWPPREHLRLFTTIHDALERSGFEEPWRHITVISPVRNYRQLQQRTWGFLLFSNRPFSESQLAILDKRVSDKNWAYLYRPGLDVDTPFQEFIDANDKHDFYRSYPYPYIVTPARDSNPFFFQFALPWSNWLATQKISKSIYGTSSTLLFLCLALAVVLTVLLLGIPLFLRRADLAGDANRASSVLYFGCLGLGFMAFELPVIQIMTLFLGHPTYALSVVLLGLLAAAGLGSSLMGRAPVGAAVYVLPAIVGLAGASALGLLPAVHALIHLPDWARFSVTLVYLALIGVPLGMPFVAGVRLLDSERVHQVAWAWAVNGASAVVGTCTLMILMVYTGSGAAFIVAAVCYTVALLVRSGLAARPAP